MPKKLVYAGIIALAVIALVLGYKIYQQQIGKGEQSITPNQQVNNATTPNSEVNQATPDASLSRTPSAAEISAVLNFPGPNATAEERKKHSDLVNKLGDEAGFSFLNISGCKPVPVVYRVKLGSTFKVKNTDSVDHTIYTAKKVTIKANSEQTLNSKEIGDNLGDYGYGCDNSSGAAGIIQIIP